MNTSQLPTREFFRHTSQRVGVTAPIPMKVATLLVALFVSGCATPLTYYKDGSREWVSVSGIATVTRDRDTIRQLWAEDWRAWFPDEGDPRHGTPDDPRMVLIGVQIHGAEFLEVNEPKPIVLYEVIKGWLTSTEPKVGEMHTITGSCSAAR